MKYDVSLAYFSKKSKIVTRNLKLMIIGVYILGFRNISLKCVDLDEYWRLSCSINRLNLTGACRGMFFVGILFVSV